MGCRSSKHGFSKVRVSETARSGTNSVTSSSRKLFSKKIRSVTSWSSGQWNSTAVLKTPETSKETSDNASSKELQFSDFCTTKATYNKFGSKTSTITVRLSSDGSTLQIEQCEIPADISIQRSESAPCLGCRKGKLENNINKTFTVAAQMTPFSLGGFGGHSRESSFNTIKTVNCSQITVEEIGEINGTELKIEQEEATKMNGAPPQVATNMNFETSPQCTCADVGISECTCLLEDEINKNFNSQLQNVEFHRKISALNLHNDHVNQDFSNNNLMDGCTKLKYSMGKILHCYKTQLNDHIMDINSAYERIPATESDHFEKAETLASTLSHTDMLTNDLHDDQWADCDIRHLYECSNPTLNISLSPATSRDQLSVCGLYDDGLYEDDYPDMGQEYSPSVVSRRVPRRVHEAAKDLILPDHDAPQGRRDFINVFFRF
ncbi:uncharacterized protein LOC121369318 [Gigantopelta aegis]|uniref:uncharacterized protein LOC121369318 n=1 Tax=Gigantopelta aegis TaxID=1735272 RepID=UPI001B88C82F|nr:uncharacterized protein LOC121369318 [Gigantopelta aegis]